MLMLRDI